MGETDLKMQISRLVSQVKRQDGSVASCRAACAGAQGKKVKSLEALKGRGVAGEVMRAFRRNSHCV